MGVVLLSWAVQFGDGRLAIWYPNGTYKQVSSETHAHPSTRKKVAHPFQSSRRIAFAHECTCVLQIFPDSRTVVRFSNGDVKTSVPSTGTVMYYYAAAKTTQTSFKDGLEVFEFPSGQV